PFASAGLLTSTPCHPRAALLTPDRSERCSTVSVLGTCATSLMSAPPSMLFHSPKVAITRPSPSILVAHPILFRPSRMLIGCGGCPATARRLAMNSRTGPSSPVRRTVAASGSTIRFADPTSTVAQSYAVPFSTLSLGPRPSTRTLVSPSPEQPVRNTPTATPARNLTFAIDRTPGRLAQG